VAEILLTSANKQTIQHSAVFLLTCQSASDGNVTINEDANDSDPSDETLSHAESVSLVLEAARDYFNTAANFRDEALGLAR